MQYILGIALKYVLNILYMPMKLLRRKNKIVYLSRQSNDMSLDMQLLSGEIRRLSPDTEQVFRLRMIGKSLPSKIGYVLDLIGDMYHIATASVAICDTYSIAASCLKHKENLYIIQMWHAMGAIKKFGLQSVGKSAGRDVKLSKALNMHENYDCVLAPSKATASFYSKAFGTSADRIKILTLPRIDYILGNQDKIKTKFEKDNPDMSGKKKVLYLPTFREDEKRIVESIKPVFEQSGDVAFIVSLHPLSKINDGHTDYNGNYNVFDLMMVADTIITDYSACAFEASVLDKPLYFYVPDYEAYRKDRGLNIQLCEEMQECVYYDPVLLYNSIAFGEYPYRTLRTFRERYVENTADCTKKMAKYICSVNRMNRKRKIRDKE